MRVMLLYRRRWGLFYLPVLVLAMLVTPSATARLLTVRLAPMIAVSAALAAWLAFVVLLAALDTFRMGEP